MPENIPSRRSFVKGAAGAAAAWSIIKPESVRGTEANSRVKVGLLGTGRRGSRVSGYFVEHAGAELTALADIYDDQIAAARDSIPAKEATAYKSAKAILDADIDAIYIATPPYLHPEHFELAVESGKHIMMEKPVASDPAGVRRVLAAAKKLKPDQMVVIVFQQRYGKDYLEAYERVKNGEIGEIRMIRTAWISSDLPRRTGHAESEEKVRNWLFYKEFSGDIIVEQNCHNIDVARWFTGAHPVAAMGYGHRAVRTDIGDIVDTLTVNYKMPDGVVYSHSGNQICPRRGYRDVGEYFFGTQGVITTNRQGYSLHVGSDPVVRRETNYDITKDVVDHFLKGVRGEVSRGNIVAEACESTLTAIMGRVAMEKGREVTWDEVFNM